jgi:outer membrane protein TolC
MATERNHNVKNQHLEKQKTQNIIDETYSALYPKINIGASYQDQLKMPVMVLPGEIFGMPGEFLPVTMGVQYNVNAAASLNMILYNQTALTALKVARKVNELNELAIEKVKEEIGYEVAKLYYMTINTGVQKNLLDDNIAKMRQLRNITKVLVDNGIALPIDLDRVDVNIENILTQLNMVEAGLEQQMWMMKYILDIPLDAELIFTDDPETSLITYTLAGSNNFAQHIDIRLLDNQLELHSLNKKITNSGYFPSLMFTSQYAFQGMRSKFANFFNNHPENK